MIDNLKKGKTFNSKLESVPKKNHVILNNKKTARKNLSSSMFITWKQGRARWIERYKELKQK